MVNEEYIPTISDSEVNMSDENIFYPASKQNVSGIRNFIAPDSSFINVNGADNNVASGCRYVNIQGSSGCIVQAGLNNVSIINSSGVTADMSNQIWVNSKLHPIEDYVIIETNYRCVVTDCNIEHVGSNASTITIPEGMFKTGKRLRFLNCGTVTIHIAVETGGIGNDGVSTPHDLRKDNTLVLIFNGTNWRIVSDNNAV